MVFKSIMGHRGQSFSTMPSEDKESTATMNTHVLVALLNKALEQRLQSDNEKSMSIYSLEDYIHHNDIVRSSLNLTLLNLKSYWALYSNIFS